MILNIKSIIVQSKSKYHNYLDYIASTVTALGWVVIQKNPADVQNNFNMP